MFKRKGLSKLGMKTSHRKLMLTNLVASLFKSGAIVTTTSRAKALRGEAERLINVAKKGKTLETTKRVMQTIQKKEAVEKVFEYVNGPKVGVKMVKVGIRPGDNAEKTKVFLLGLEDKKKEGSEEKKSVVKKVKSEEKKSKVVGTERKGVQKGVAVKKERVRTRAGI